MKALMLSCVLLTVPSFAQGADLPADAGVSSAPVASTVAADAGTPAGSAVQVKLKFGEGVSVGADEFSLSLRGRVQMLGVSLIPTTGGLSLAQHALLVRRASLMLKGSLPYKLTFTMELGFANSDLEPDAPNPLRDFYVTWAPLRDLSLRFGQMKVPFDVQQFSSDTALQLVDRSLVAAELALDRDAGLILFSDDLFGLGKRLRYAVGVFGGDGRNRTGMAPSLLYSARLRFSPMGAFDDRAEGDPERSNALRVAFGLGVAHDQQTNRPRSTGGTPYKVALQNYNHATLDAQLRWHGLSLIAEAYWRQATLHPDATGTLSAATTGLVSGASVTEYSRNGWGWFAQAGYYATPWLEFSARYGDLRPLGPSDPTFTETREIGGGVNFYFVKHDLKLQTDAFWLDDGQGNRGRLQVRVQAQVYF